MCIRRVSSPMPPVNARPPADQGLRVADVTLLFTDIEGSTRLVQRLGEAYADELGRHRKLVRAAVAAHKGTEIDCRGDEFSIGFDDADDAVAAAAAIQAAHDDELRVR